MKARRKKAGRGVVQQLRGKVGLDGGVHSSFHGKVGNYADVEERRLEQKHLRAYLRGDSWFVHQGQHYPVKRGEGGL